MTQSFSLIPSLLFLIGIVSSTFGDFISTHELNWAGGTQYCTQGEGQGAYACTGNGTDSAAGDWNDGTKYFTDTQTDLSYVVSQVNFSIQGSFDCYEDATVSVYLNEQRIGRVLVQTNSAEWCPICGNSWASNNTAVTASEDYPTGWPDYVYGHINEIYVQVENVSVQFCLSRVTLYLMFTSKSQSDSSSSSGHIDLDAPTWFWTLLIMGVAILLVLAVVFFTLWRRSQALGYSSMGYRPLSTHEFVDPSQLEDIKIDSDQLELMEEIGRGSFGQVFRGKWRGTDVAVKRIPTNSMREAETRDFMKEAFILRQLRHPNVLQVLGASMEPACIVTEFMPRGNLFNVIHDSKIELAWPMVRKIALDVCKGMSYLHGCTPPLIHRDLKPHNLLVDDNWRVKVSDFGLSKFVEPQHEMTACGTPAYAAPEVLRNSAYSTSADVYSFGIVLWELLTREALYPGMPPFQIIFVVGTQKSRPAIPAGRVPPHLAALIQECWDEDPDKRPSFIQLTDIFEKGDDDQHDSKPPPPLLPLPPPPPPPPS